MADTWPGGSPDRSRDGGRHGGTGSSRGGGVWSYADPANDAIRLLVDFGGRSQLRYWVRTMPVGPVRPTMLTLEGAMGLPQSWDWITEDGAQAAAELLVECVAACHDLAERAAALF